MARAQSKKPTAVLLGWLGCQPHNLRRYSEMYERMGWDTATRIASPASVVAAVAEGPSDQPTQSEMKRLAHEILRDLQRIQPPCFIFHVFSNNGCFVWEWIRYMLFEESALLSAADPNVDANKMRQKLIGIVFDSAPAHYEGKTNTLQSALEYVSPAAERERLLAEAKSLDASTVGTRFDEFWSGLRDDSTGIPQLYLYGQFDKLACAKHLQQVIATRETILGKAKVWKHRFADSEHCSHLRKYPEIYDGFVKRFVSFCLRSQIGGAGGDDRFAIRSRL